MENPASEPLAGYKQMNPMVFAGIYPIDSNKYNDLREALEKLQLNDASLQFEPETSQATGFGFRCGFLGLLHMDVIQERIEREFNIDLIMTAPSVVYHARHDVDGETIDVANPSEFPDPTKIASIEEPYVKAQIMVPQEYVGAVMELTQRKRGDFVTMDYIDDNQNVIYQIPLAEIVFDFFDKLKSSTRG